MSSIGLWAALYFAAVAINVVLAGLALYRREKAGSLPLALFLLALAVGATGQGLYRLATTYPEGAFAFQLGMVGTAFVPIGWIYFGIRYAGRDAWEGPRTVAVLSIEPLVLVILILVPQTQSLVVTPDPTTPPAMVGLGVFTLVHFVYYLLSLVFGTLLFLQLFLRSRHLYRAQAGALLFAATIPWVGQLVYISPLFQGVDVTSYLLTLSGIGMTLALYQFKLLDPVPVAQDTVFEEMGEGVVVLTEDDCIGRANPAASELLAGDADDLQGLPISDLVDDWECLRAESGPTDWHERPFEVNGETRHVEVQVSPFHDRMDEFVGRLVLLRDVTDRKRREQLLARYKTIFESVHDRVLVLDEDDEFLIVNEPMAEFVGMQPDELEGQSFDTVLADTVADGGQVSRLLDADPGETVEVTVETTDGEQIPCETQLAPIELGSEVTGVVGILRDISRLKRAERDLAETSERLETLVEASPLAIVAADRDARVEVWNPAAESIFGWSAEEVLGELPPFVPEDERERVQGIHRRVIGGERLTDLELELRRADGSTIDASVSIAPVADVSGEIRGTVAVIADVTDRKERERKLRQQNEQLEQFTSIVSHDLRNPLSVAQGYTEMIAANDDPSVVSEVQTSLDRMEELIDDVLSIARQGQTVDPDDVETVDLAAMAKTAWDTVDTGPATLDVGDGTGRVRADPRRLREILENLFRNSVEHGSTSNRPKAGDSVEHGSEDVSVRVGPLQAVKASDGSGSDAVGGSENGFFVEDDGPGIPPDERGDVFDSGYTTSREGTGLGLSIVSDFAQAHGWSVELTASDAGGARFEFHGVDSRDLEGRH